jgi:hypothetical protein
MIFFILHCFIADGWAFFVYCMGKFGYEVFSWGYLEEILIFSQH